MVRTIRKISNHGEDTTNFKTVTPFAEVFYVADELKCYWLRQLIYNQLYIRASPNNYFYGITLATSSTSAHSDVARTDLQSWCP